MKKLSWIDKLIYFFNAVFAVLLLFSFLLPYISPIIFPIVSLLNFGIPVLIIVNFLFFLYWLVKAKLHFLLSLLSLLIGFNYITSIYEFSKKEPFDEKKIIRLMSYNVHHFFGPREHSNDNHVANIEAFIRKEKPDILIMQDYSHDKNLKLIDAYPFVYLEGKRADSKNSLIIYSSFPIIKKHNFNFPKSSNNAIFADIVVKGDTLRLFNIHFQSLQINPNIKELQESDKEKLANRLGESFRKQVDQLALIKPHIENSPYPVIVAGDFNNTAFSYLYKELSSLGLVDAFSEKGRGFGKTYDFDFIPIRIDFSLFSEEDFKIHDFINYEVEYSDHYPIKTIFEIK